MRINIYDCVISLRDDVMFWRMQACSLSILLNWNYCDLQLQYIRWFVLFSVVHTICHCQSRVMTIIISNSTTRSLSVRLGFQKKQFWHLPLPVNVPLRVRVWPLTMATSRPTRTLAKKLTVQVSFLDFFSVLTQIQMDTLLTTGCLRLLWDWWILNDIETVLPNAHFRYRGSIEYRDTWDGIVIVAPISGVAQHYLRVAGERRRGLYGLILKRALLSISWWMCELAIRFRICLFQDGVCSSAE